MEQLKLADVDAVFVAGLAPLDASTSGIEKAAQLIDQGQYYQANQALKHVEDGVRLDALHITGIPQQNTQSSSNKATTSSTKMVASTANSTAAAH